MNGCLLGTSAEENDCFLGASEERDCFLGMSPAKDCFLGISPVKDDFLGMGDEESEYFRSTDAFLGMDACIGRTGNEFLRGLDAINEDSPPWENGSLDFLGIVMFLGVDFCGMFHESNDLLGLRSMMMNIVSHYY
jgi:hypothetical protein